MKKFKKILLVFAVIFSLITFVALFLPFFLNLNHFKPKIQAMVSEKFNAQIDFKSARLNLFGGLGLKLKDVTVEMTSKPFAGEKIFSAENVEIEFDILPIFKHKLIGTVYLDTPTMKIVKIESKDNFSALTKSITEDKSEKNSNSNESHNFTLIIKEFSVNHANILFEDLSNKSSPTVVNLKDINIDMTREGQVLNIENLTMTLFSGQLTSHMKIDLADPEIAYSGDCDLKNFSLADIYHSFGAPEKASPLNGQANLNIQFNGRGTTKDVYSKSLNGTGTFKIKKGTLKIDTAMPVILNQLSEFFASLPIPGFNLGISKEDLKKAGNAQDTTIILDNMQGNFEIKKGMLYFKNDIPMTQGLLKVDVVIGLFTSSLKGTANFEATDAFTKTLVSTNKNFIYLLDKNNRFYLKVTLGGTVTNPDIHVDTSNILTNILTRAGKSILNPVETIPNIFKGIFGQ